MKVRILVFILFSCPCFPSTSHATNPVQGTGCVGPAAGSISGASCIAGTKGGGLVLSALLTPVALQAPDPSGASKPRLECLNVEQPDSDVKNSQSCDEICAQHDAACVAPISISTNPPGTCASPVSNLISACRCCAVVDGK